MNNRDSKKNYQGGVTSSNNNNGNLTHFASRKAVNADYPFEGGFQKDYNKVNVRLFNFRERRKLRKERRTTPTGETIALLMARRRKTPGRRRRTKVSRVEGI